MQKRQICAGLVHEEIYGDGFDEQVMIIGFMIIMKYIFRYTILNYYTLDQRIAREDLNSAIDSSFPYKDKVDSLIDLFKEIIEELIHSKQAEKVQAIIQNNLQEEYPGDYQELTSVWQN